MTTSLRTEVQVAGQVVVRLVNAALIPGSAQGIRRAADALGIPVDAIRQANELLRRSQFEPPYDEPCRLRAVVAIETPPPQASCRSTGARQRGPAPVPGARL